ncbi:MAG: hypothetical protein WAT91_10915, partial [Saprospiraceae bacterium]
MKKILTITIFTSFLLSFAIGQSSSKKENGLFRSVHSSARSRSVFSYTLTTFTEPYNDLTGATSLNNGEIWDEPEYIFPIAFPFELNGNSITYLQFTSSGSASSSPTPDPQITTLVFPFETDLIDRGALGLVSLSPISYKVEGVAPNRIEKMEFKNAGSYYEMDSNNTLNMFINFQLWLYEGSYTVEFHFGSHFINDPGLFYDGEIGAYIGITDADVDNEILYSPHFLGGSAVNPALSTLLSPINGTPDDGIVYRLSLAEPLIVNVAGQNATSFCAPNGSATAIVSGGTAPYTYLWNNGNTTQTISNLNAGTYTLTVTDASAMTATGSTTITIPNPIEVNASSTDETAVNANDGTAIAMPTDGLPPYGWLWSNGSAGFEIVDLAPGIYTVTITDDAGCTASQSVVVNAFGCPPLEIISSVLDVSCNGLCNGAIQINDVDQGVGPFIYMWSNGSASS